MEVQSSLVTGVAEHFRSFITIMSEEVLVCRPKVIAQMIVELVLEEFGFLFFHIHRTILRYLTPESLEMQTARLSK